MLTASKAKNIFKKFFWPIETHEHKFFVSMALLLMFALYNFAALRSIKDSLVVPNIGAESISFLKLWLVLPSAIIFTVVYLKLSNLYTADKVFYIITSSFIIFFLIFTFFLYPNREIIHPDGEYISELINFNPKLKWFLMIYAKWSFALMYVFSELWSVVVINLMFWQFANYIVDTKDAKRFYPLFGVLGNVGLILAGNNLIFFANSVGIPDYVLEVAMCKGSSNDDITLRLSILSVVFAGIIVQFMMYYLNNFVIKEVNLKFHSTDKTVTKLSLRESVLLILRSRYIFSITMIIVCYGLSINIVEGPWKAKIQELYPSQHEYLDFMGRFNIWMGISCISFMVLGSNFIRFLPWIFSALFTPIVIGISGFLFYSFIVFEHFFTSVPEFIVSNPVFAAIIAGSFQNIISKSSKYSLFDSTKEMAYIPLSVELKTKGKASAEVIGAKFGKSIGAIIQSVLFIFITDAKFDDISPVLMCIFGFIISFWIYNVFKLSKQYNNLVNNS